MKSFNIDDLQSPLVTPAYLRDVKNIKDYEMNETAGGGQEAATPMIMVGDTRQGGGALLNSMMQH